MTMEDPEENVSELDGDTFQLYVTSDFPHLATFERYAQKIRREAWKQLEASGKLPFA